MMSKRDLDLVAEVIYELVLDQTVLRYVSEGNRRRAIALAFARALREQKNFDEDAFLDKACHNI